MAKPGSNGARDIAAAGRARALDLTRAGLGDREALAAQEAIELALGGRCDGCGRRIGIGCKFSSIDPRAPKPVLTLSACTRQDCDFAEQAREGATCMEMVEFVWLDEAGIDAPPAEAIVERALRRAQAVQAAQRQQERAPE